MKMNTIRLGQNDEPARDRRSLGVCEDIDLWGKPTQSPAGNGHVDGGSRSGKEGVVNAGDLPGQDARETVCRAGVRAAVVARKPGNTGGAKGGRKANASGEGQSEGKPAEVPGKDKQAGEDLWQRHKAERGVWSQKMLEALEEGAKGNKWFSLIDKINREDTLEKAWEKVRDNAGACGVDRITVEHFAKDSARRLLAVKEQIKQGSYQPQGIKRVRIPKPGSTETRPLGIPVVRDRVVQTALKMGIEPIFERQFAEQSYGFRPGRSCKDALRRVEELLQSGHYHVVDIDIRGYFDAIPHGRLMERVKEHIADGRVLALIEAFLKQQVMEEMESWENESGTPQGGVISPLLANIYLNPLDWLMAESGLEMVRYADDIVVLCRTEEKSQEAMKQIGGWMEQAGLELHPEKTRRIDMNKLGNHFDFLGYRFWRGKKGNLRRFIRPKSRQSLREKIKPLTKRTNGQSLEAIIARINPILCGWHGYYRHASANALREIDGWVRGRLRAILRKRRGGQGRGRGRDNHRWGNRYFAEHGLFCLIEARAEDLSSLQNGVKC